MTSQATIFVVDDDASVRKGLSRLLRTCGYRVEALESAEAFLEQEQPSGPSCLVLDLQMPRISGLELQERMGRLGYELPIIFLTGHGDIPKSVSAIKKGATNFLTKPVDDEALLSSVAEALEHHRKRLAEAAEKRAVRGQLDTLSAREFEVMQCVISGALNKQIAAHLGIAEKTVKIHRGRVMQKLNVDSVAELVRLCAMAGIPSTPVNLP